MGSVSYQSEEGLALDRAKKGLHAAAVVASHDCRKSRQYASEQTLQF